MIIKYNNEFISATSFSIVRSEKSQVGYNITLTTNVGELNPSKLFDKQNFNGKSSLLEFVFKSHTENYSGDWVNFATRWKVGEEAENVFFFSGVRLVSGANELAPLTNLITTEEKPVSSQIILNAKPGWSVT